MKNVSLPVSALLFFLAVITHSFREERPGTSEILRSPIVQTHAASARPKRTNPAQVKEENHLATYAGPEARNDTFYYLPSTYFKVNLPVIDNDVTTGFSNLRVVITTPGTDDTTSLHIAGEGYWDFDYWNPSIVVFYPLNSFKGSPTPIKYALRDQNGVLSNEATITLIAEKPPIATGDARVYHLGDTISVNLLANDTTGVAPNPASVRLGTHTDGDGKSFDVWGGRYTVDQAGILHFTPRPGIADYPPPFNALPDSIAYTVANFRGIRSAPATIYLHPDPIPVASNDVTTYTSGTTKVISILSNDNNGDVAVPSTVRLTGAGAAPDGKSQVVSGQGTWTVDPVTGILTFAPESGYSGSPDAVTYTVQDAQGNTSLPASVFLYANTRAVATDDNVTYQPGQTRHIFVLANDTQGEPLVGSSVRLTGSGVTNDGRTLVVPGVGTWTIAAAVARLTFTPVSGFTGSPAPVYYSGKNNQGILSNTAMVTLTVDPLPLASNDSVSYTPGTAVTVPVTANDNQGDAVVPSTVKIVTAGASADGKTFSISGEGTWAVHPTDGSITFSPLSGYNGTPLPIRYTVADAQGNVTSPATVKLIATGTAPIAQNDVGVYHPGYPATIHVLANDTTGAAPVASTVEIVTTGAAPDRKSLTVSGQGSWTVHSTDGTLTFTPATNYRGNPAPLDYQVKDAAANRSNTAKVTLTADLLPVASDDIFIFKTDPTNDIRRAYVLLNDTTGDAVVESSLIITEPGTTSAGKVLVVPGKYSWLATSGSFFLFPEPGFKGTPAPVTYAVRDAQGNLSNKATLTTIVELTPETRPDTGRYIPGTPATVNVLANDTTGDAIVPATMEIWGPNQIPNKLALVIVPGEGKWELNRTTGLLVFTPEPGFVGTTSMIKYRGSDAQGNISNPSTVQLRPLSSAPTALNDASLYLAAKPKAIDVTANDIGGTTPVKSTVRIITAGVSPDGKSLSAAGQGSWVVDPVTGIITFTPNAGYKGSPTPISYTVQDAAGHTSNAATVTLTVDLPPVAVNDTAYYFAKDRFIRLTPLNNDTSDDGLSFRFVSPGATWNEWTSPQGDYYYFDDLRYQVNCTPAAASKGRPVPVAYQLKDGHGNLSDTAYVVFILDPIPVVTNDVYYYHPGTTIEMNVLANDTTGDAFIPSSLRIIGNSPVWPYGFGTEIHYNGTWKVDTLKGTVSYSPDPGPPTTPDWVPPFPNEPMYYIIRDAQGNSSDPGSITLVRSVPVTLVHFSGRPAGRSVALSWRTSSESNFDRFVVERYDPDKEVFSPIGEIPGGTYQYVFTDHNPTRRDNYYRLRMIDKDRSVEFSKTISVESGGPDAVVSPNPVRGGVFQLRNAASAENIHLYSASGQRIPVSIAAFNGYYEIRLLQSSTGIHLLEWDSSGKRHTSKILIE